MPGTFMQVTTSTRWGAEESAHIGAGRLAGGRQYAARNRHDAKQLPVNQIILS